MAKPKRHILVLLCAEQLTDQSQMADPVHCRLRWTGNVAGQDIHVKFLVVCSLVNVQNITVAQIVLKCDNIKSYFICYKETFDMKKEL